MPGQNTYIDRYVFNIFSYLSLKFKIMKAKKPKSVKHEPPGPDLPKKRNAR